MIALLHLHLAFCVNGLVIKEITPQYANSIYKWRHLDVTGAPVDDLGFPVRHTNIFYHIAFDSGEELEEVRILHNSKPAILWTPDAEAVYWGIFTNETAEIDQIGNLGFLDLFLSNMSFSGDYNFTFLTNHSDHNLRRTWQVITLNPISRCHHLNYNSLGIDLNQCTLEIRMDCQYPVFPLDSVHYSMFWNSSTDPTFSLPFDEPRRLERYDGSSFLAFHVQVDLRRIPVNQLQANIHLRHDKYTFQRTEEFVKPEHCAFVPTHLVTVFAPQIPVIRETFTFRPSGDNFWGNCLYASHGEPCQEAQYWVLLLTLYSCTLVSL